MGLHAHPRCAEERRPSCRAIDDCSDSESAGHSSGAGTPDIVAGLLAGTLGCDLRRGFLHDGSVDVAGLGVLNPLETTCPTKVVRRSLSTWCLVPHRTSTGMMALTPPSRGPYHTVTVARPAPTAVIVPDACTVATAVSDDS